MVCKRKLYYVQRNREHHVLKIFLSAFPLLIVPEIQEEQPPQQEFGLIVQRGRFSEGGIEPHKGK